MSNWANQRAFQNYKRELHGRLLAQYNRRHFQPRITNAVMRMDNVKPMCPIIQIERVVFELAEDGTRHHTAHFDLMHDANPMPVLRRGQPFTVTLCFNRPFDTNNDSLHFMSQYGPSPSLSNGTRYKIVLSDNAPDADDDEHWEIWKYETRGLEMKVKIQSPIDCQVGLWKFTFFTYKSNIPENCKFDVENDVFILFNPWYQNDAVFMDDVALRQECVLCDHAKLWMGTNASPVGYPWSYAQSDAAILLALPLLLNQSDVPHAHRGNAVLVTRALSAVINAKDDAGLLEGKWEGDFSDGMQPVSWTGSIAIFEQYLQNYRPVKYGQCWVFAAALTTACRALGIPSRTVTCFECAHDTDDSLTVDRYFSADGRRLKEEDSPCGDSMWNFHCWNDVWMTRPDLPPGYGGWQAVDATPQEISDFRFRTGPASLMAVKQGDIGLQYDVGFLFSEVNADLFHFQEDPNSPWGYTRIKLDTKFVGERVVTQSVNCNAYGDRWMEDITSLYKNKEGSDEERASVFNALRSHPKAQKFYMAVNTTTVKDVFFKPKDLNVVFISEPFTVELSVENHASVRRTVKANLCTSSCLYTGRIVEVIKQEDSTVTLAPKEAKVLQLTVTSAEYKDKIKNNTQVKTTVVARVVETNQAFSAEDVFEIMKKKLDIRVPDKTKIGSPYEVVFTFGNPLSESLTGCELIIEAPGLDRPKVVKLSVVQSRGVLRHVERLIPNKPGSRVLVVTFNCDQLPVVKGFTKLNVTSDGL